MNYNFAELDDKEFELLVNDLLGKEYNLTVDRFKSGKDGGIDGRFEYDNKKIAIIQTKQYLRSGYKQLIYKLKNEELKKVIKLFDEKKLTKYIFATDLPLSQINKEEIKEIFKPYIESTEDIFGNQNLNQLLSLNEDIERKYYRLWIKSTNVLNNILNNAILGRSQFSFEEIVEKSKMFVEIRSFNEALKKIEKDRVIIIVGEPGIGKSTLSENLCLRLVSKHKESFDYEFIDMKEGINEAENMWNRDRKQLFYYDDFLGSNYFEAITDNKDSHIMQFISRVNKSNNKIFILNSRTNILNYGKEYSDKFKIGDIAKNEFTLEISNLTRTEKADILYKHIVHSDLSIDYINEIYKNKNYLEIIDHKNFNPRLIEFITSANRITVKAQEYFKYVKDTLYNPLDIWKHYFDTQSNDYIRGIVCLLVFNGQGMLERDLRSSYNRLFKGKDNTSNTSKKFDSIIGQLIESFVNKNINKNTKEVSYSLFNPSIADFVLHKYIDDEDELINIFESLGSYEGVMHLKNLHSIGIRVNESPFSKNFKKYENKCISSVSFNSIIKALFDTDLDEKDANYVLCLLEVIEQDKVSSTLQKFVDEFKVINYGALKIFLKLLVKDFTNLNIKDHTFIIKYIKNITFDEIILLEMSHFLNKLYEQDGFKGFDKNLVSVIKEKTQDYFMQQMLDAIENYDFNSLIIEDKSDYHNHCLESDEEGFIKKNIINDSQKILDVYQKKFHIYESSKPIDLKEVYSWIDRDMNEEFEDFKNGMKQVDDFSDEDDKIDKREEEGYIKYLFTRD